MDNQVTVEISARHVHLSQADLETLFGKGYELTVKKMLSLAAGKELTEAESCKLLSAVGLCSADYLNRQMDGTLSGGEMKTLGDRNGSCKTA